MNRAARIYRIHTLLRAPDALQAASLLVTDPDGAFRKGDGDCRKVSDLRVYRVQV